ncbi:MAG TPA: CopD family protein [Steroidobacteraceae bacterium]|jgi:copper transport protein|nr:CopD family protein [Steroidobacteraceae bacterium]
MSPDTLSVAVRALAFIAIFQATGAVFFVTLFVRADLPHLQASVARVARIAAICASVLIALHGLLDAARLAGDYSGLADAGLQRLAWSSSGGISQLVQIAGLLAVATSAGRLTRPLSRSVVLVGALLTIGAFALTGHTSEHPLRALLAPLLLLHLLIVAVWFGALLPLVITLRTERTASAAAIFGRFSLIAGALVPLIAVAGLTMAALLSGSFSVLYRPYGKLLLVKLAAFALLMGLAAYNRWWLVPALEPMGAAGQARTSASSALRRSMGAEYLLIVLVLATTAALTALFSPR